MDVILEENIAVPEGYYEYLGIESPVEKNRAAAEPGKKYVPIKLWVYRDNDGTGNINTTQAYQIIDELNNIYSNNTNLVFYLLCDISFINNSNYANNAGQYFSTFTLNNKFPNVMNVHMVMYSNPNGWAGRGNIPSEGAPLGQMLGPRAFSCAVTTKIQGTGSNRTIQSTARIMAHEIGHALELYHTHQGRQKGKNNGQCGDCYQESVSRTKTQGVGCLFTMGKKKCKVNGDLLCDTEADPYINYNVNGSCMYTGGGTDNWGDAWIPNGNNIMAYTSSSCMNYFSPMQVAKMNLFVQYMDVAYPTFAITGPNRLCAGETATYTVTSLPGVSQYYWEVPASMTILSTTPYSNSILVQASTSEGGIISVLPSCGSRPAYFNVKDSTEYEVTGYDSGCPNEIYTYSVPYIAGASYNWNAVINAQILPPTNSHTVQVKLLPGSQGYSHIRADITYCDTTIYAHKQINHGDPPPPAPQCFAPMGGENNKMLEIPVQDFVLYPNPTTNSITAIIPNDDIYSLSIYNVKGQLVYNQQNLKNIECIINTTTYSAGVYIINLTSTTGNTLTKRFIIKK